MVSAKPRTSQTGFPEEFLDLTLDEAILIALQDTQVLRNLGANSVTTPQSVTTVFDPAIVATDPNFGAEAALSSFDAQFAAGLTLNKNDDVFNNPVLGGNAQEVRSDIAAGTYSLSKISGVGTQFAIQGNVQHTDTNSPGVLFPHLWETTWEASVRQPLLQGSGARFNQIAGPINQPGFRNTSGVLISRIDHEVSRVQLEGQLNDMVEEIIAAYWRLNQAYKNLESTKEVRDASRNTNDRCAVLRRICESIVYRDEQISDGI